MLLKNRWSEVIIRVWWTEARTKALLAFAVLDRVLIIVV